MRIRTRLLLVLAVPTLLLVAGVAVEAAARAQARSAAGETAQRATLVLAAQNLVHALQRERALLTALFAGEGRVRADLAPAWLATDRARSALARLLAAAPPSSYGPVREALARLPALDRARTATPALPAAPDIPATPGGPLPRAERSGCGPSAALIGPYGTPVHPLSGNPADPEVGPGSVADAHPATDAPPLLGPVDLGPVVRQDVFEAFTDAIAQLLDGSFAETPDPDDPTLVRRMRALEAISRAKEAAARERAVVTAGFATGGFTSSEYIAFLEARASLADSLAGFRRLTTPEGAAELARAQRGTQAARTGRLERRALAASPGTAPGASGVSPGASAGVFPGASAGASAGVFPGASAGASPDASPGASLGLSPGASPNTPPHSASRLPSSQLPASPPAASQLSAPGSPPIASPSIASPPIASPSIASPGAASSGAASPGVVRPPDGSPGPASGGRTRAWLAASSAYVDALHAVQRSTGEELRAHAMAVRERHTRHLTWLTAAGAAFLLVMAVLGGLLVRSIVRPLRKLTGEATAMARHIAVLEAGDPAHPACPVPDGRAAGHVSRPGHLWRAYNAALPPWRIRSASYGRKVHDAGLPTAGDAGRIRYEDRLAMPVDAASPDQDEVVGRSECSARVEVPGGAAVRDVPSGRDGTAPDEDGTEPGGEREAGRGEFGQLAGALGDMHEAAVRIADARAASRRDTAASLGGLGMRHRDLVHRQLTFISALQRNESDPAVLARLCELDRLTSRLRRNAESLLVLTGKRGQRRSSEPVPVDEVLRSVLAEIEDHHRVALRVVGRAYVRGPVVAEVAHMLAELMENALGYSPPDTEVNVVARADEGECRITISDHGVGMTAAELEAANARLRGEQSFLVAPTRCLGHHVVGRLAERLGVRVALHDSAGCGVTARVALPEELLAARPAELVRGTR
ncbi:nitrate- and nitrite sensing domain-containing protein [Nonomuraea sp. NPDC048826]|uniref:nitrate- and nitrite sensing domain-containing protein n=1 Tax=Nonomuraea sp. NPDC048826 TaxID=3364347 RepID=UPI003722FA47